MIPSNPEYWTSSEYMDEGPYILAAHIKKGKTRNNTKKLDYDWVMDKLDCNQPLNYFFSNEKEILKFGESSNDSLGRLNRYRHKHPDKNHMKVLNELYDGKNPRLYVRLAEGKMVDFKSGKDISYEDTNKLERKHITRYEEAVGIKPIANSKLG